MARIAVSTHIAAPVEKVFHLFSDLENAAGRVKGIKKIEVLTPGPVGVGTRFRETRVLFKREATEEMEFTAFEPNRGYTVECDSCGSHYRSVYRFEPDGDGTRVEADFEARPRSLFAWMLAPLGLLMMGAVKNCFQQDLEDLKAVAEATSQAE